MTRKVGGATITPVLFTFWFARLAKLIDWWDHRRIRAGRKIAGVMSANSGSRRS